MNKKNVMKTRSSVIFILTNPSLIQNSTNNPPDLRQRQTKLEQKPRIMNLSISEMMGSKLHLF